MSQLTRRPKQDSVHMFKAVVLGEQGSGKTSFIKRYVHQYYSPAYRSTIGVDFALKMLLFDGTTLVRLQLWDVGGQERLGSMTRIYYKDAHGAFIMFDLTKPESFEAVLRWKADLDSKVKLANGEDVPCLLVANKCDLKPSAEEKDGDYLRSFARQNGFIDCIFISPKANINIEQAVNLLLRHLMKQHQNQSTNQHVDAERTNTIKLTKPLKQQRLDASRNKRASGCYC